MGEGKMAKKIISIRYKIELDTTTCEEELKARFEVDPRFTEEATLIEIAATIREAFGILLEHATTVVQKEIVGRSETEEMGE